MSLYTVKTEQKIPVAQNELWDFISSPINLRVITPPSMGFEVTTEGLPSVMYPGMIISYKVRPLMNIPVTWVTEITHVEHGKYFVDEQRKGPYTMWHHEHRLEAIPGGVLMNDIVSYIPPMGPLGDIANSILIKGKLKDIFEYRRLRLIEIFGEWK
ncbi:MAG: SRPBCC family protein [Flavobacteriales bacterium]|nr:SRPBCC family protein [Flavobacteriales bacterium]